MEPSMPEYETIEDSPSKVWVQLERAETGAMDEPLHEWCERAT